MKKFIQNIFLAGVLISAPLFPYTIKTPVDLGNWLAKNFTYQYETTKHEYWKSPKETVKDKGGDCEDLAFLAEHVLKKLGYETYIIIIHYKEISSSAHAVCVFKHKDGTFSYYSNLYYDSKRYNSIPEALTGQANSWGLTWQLGHIVLSRIGRYGYPKWRNK